MQDVTYQGVKEVHNQDISMGNANSVCVSKRHNVVAYLHVMVRPLLAALLLMAKLQASPETASAFVLLACYEHSSTLPQSLLTAACNTCLALILRIPSCQVAVQDLGTVRCQRLTVVRLRSKPLRQEGAPASTKAQAVGFDT